MRLERFQVTNFRSIEDSGPIDVGEEVCLVGKNEAGKTAILNALTGLNPHPSTPFAYDKERDYPRRHLTDYSRHHKDAEALVVTTIWSLDSADQEAITATLGPDALPVTETRDGLRAGVLVTANRRYGDTAPKWSVDIQHKAVIKNLLSAHKLDAAEQSLVNTATTTDQLRGLLEAIETPTDNQAALLKYINELPNRNALGAITAILTARMPTFMSFSHYDRMAGQIRLDDIQVADGVHFRQRNVAAHTNAQGFQIAAQNIRERLPMGELVFLDFLAFAGTAVDEIRNSDTYESLNSKCEAASITITDQLRDYWTQNPFLEIEIRVTRAEPKDAPPFNEGTIARARVRNTLHRVTVPFSERSAGFIWFFSFLVKFARVREQAGKVILLLDEPGLTLHGKAQADLLRYFVDRIIPEHQLLFTTHSPFMVPPEDLNLSRIVEDQPIQSRPGQWITHGTKVRDDVMARDPDTLFPLQGALGYDVTQTLFVGKKTLLVEGPGDIVFLKALSAQLKRRDRRHLHPSWAICPAGGIDKIQSFISLFAGNKLDIAVMSDFALTDRKKLDQLKRSTILSAERIMNYAEVLGLAEGDVEDIFDPKLYIKLVNGALGLTGANRLTLSKLDSNISRLVKRAEAACKLLPPEVPEFDHFGPADWLIRNPTVLDLKDPEVEQTLDNAEKVIAAIERHL
jgi:energy-coupling factor transporter ATP-binding protein EcfA2